ncbi:MAG: helix-turn-helix transcriptional regulator [Flavobacterium sp. JAD_PAG50586_2]|nr:MAG: helix-turn-helix transcriptional regulator [Flavobacterium sp. JAD_PAG50586_2]
MRAEKNISKLLGISQESLAMMLKVTRGQLSMYECGLRPIPTQAMKQLAEMIVLFYDKNTITTAKSLQEENTELHAKAIKRQLEDNLLEQYPLRKIIAKAETKYHSRISTLNFLQKLSLKQWKNESGEPTLPELLAGQTARKLQKENWTQLRQYQIKLEVLKAEERLLREELGEPE